MLSVAVGWKNPCFLAGEQVIEGEALSMGARPLLGHWPTYIAMRARSRYTCSSARTLDESRGDLASFPRWLERPVGGGMSFREPSKPCFGIQSCDVHYNLN